MLALLGVAQLMLIVDVTVVALALPQIGLELGLSRAALTWVVQQPGVSTVIPGARNAEQARANAAAGRLDPLPEELLDGVRRIYEERIREAVHGRW